MAFQVSPGINVSEINLTTVVPALSTTTGAIAGVFNWGPVNQLTLIDSETNLVKYFGKPTTDNAETWFSAANFLAYGSSLYVSRAANVSNTSSSVGAWNAVANLAASYTTNTIFNVMNQDDYATKAANSNFTDLTDIQFIAKYPGSLGNSLEISVCDTAAQYSSNLQNVTILTCNVGTNTSTINCSGATYTAANAAWQQLNVGDLITLGNSTVGFQTLQLSAKGSQPSTNQLSLSFYSNFTLSQNTATVSGNVARAWQFSSSVSAAPGQSTYVAQYGNTAANDELHVVVVDHDGKFTGSPGTILEVWQGLSRATDAYASNGAKIYYKDVLNNSSQYVWFANPRSASYVNTALNIASSSTATNAIETTEFVGGNDGSTETTMGSDNFSTLSMAWDKFGSTEDVNVSLLINGKSVGTNASGPNYVINNVAEKRKDCVAFISPRSTDVVQVPGNELINVTAFRNLLVASTYAVLDTGYKYQYDKYNDVYRYIPLNGDIAGLCAYTDSARDPWYSPAGFERGQVKNVVKLAYNPSKGARDALYPIGVNPVVSFPGQGTVLYGDKTLSAKPSAFDRINVRRLFIVLEKSIATAAQSSLFEFNDAFTRAQFVSLVTPYLKDVQARRGIYDFKVVCDDTNNTGEVIDSNRFVGDIYIKPARAINYIQLNFVAVRTGVAFSEIVGRF